MAIFKKKNENEFELSPAAADRILQGVFEKTKTEPNSIPLDVLTSYSNYRRDRYALQRILTVLVLVLFLLLPLLFFAPGLEITNLSGDAYTATPQYLLEVDTFIPIDRMNVTINGRSLPIYEVDANQYSVEPTINGTMAVTVTLLNHQFTTKTIEVSNVDVTPPVFVSNTVEEDTVYLYLQDQESGLDFSGVTATDNAGQEVTILDMKEEDGMIAFTWPEGSVNIFVPDRAGNTLQLIMSIQK